MLDSLLDALLDTLKLLPYLFVAFLLLEFLEHKLSKKNEQLLLKGKKFGPILGGLLGGLPQCGFSTMASNLFSSRIITMGTLIAVFLSTSDEMLPIMIGEKIDPLFIFGIISFKIFVGIIIGFLVDIIFAKKEAKIGKEIQHMCEEEHCDCEKEGILLSSIKHTLKIAFFILIVNVLLNIVIESIGEENVSNLLNHHNIWTYFLASLVGLIPNCASSVIMTELYISKIISLGNLLSGLLTGSGVGILILFRTNKNIKENLTIVSIIYFVGVLLGILVDIIL